jgi:hypothetical protein
VRALSILSSTPARLAGALQGIHIQPPERAVVPPKTGSFSTSTIFCLCLAATTAVERPPAPEPITRTSHSCIVFFIDFLLSMEIRLGASG